MKKSDAQKAKQKRQILRAKKRQTATLVKTQNKAVGSSAYIASIDGFSKKKAKLPRYFNELINNTRRLIYGHYLDVDSGGVTRTIPEKTKKKMFEIAVTLLTTCDLVSGQIGKPKNIGMDTTSHDALMLQHAKRWGDPIPSSTWYRYIDLLKQVGAFRVEEVKIAEAENTVRSVAAYKWLSAQFLQSIGAYKDYIRAAIKLSNIKAVKNGLSFKWREFKKKLTTKQRKTNDMFNVASVSPPPVH
jgi:hypothetical protein